MGKRVIALLLSSCLFAFPIQVKADTAKDLFKVYSINKKTTKEKAEDEYNRISSIYAELDKTFRQKDYLNTALSDLDTSHLQEELNDTQRRLQEVESEMTNGFFMSVSDINSLDNEYQSLYSYSDFLLKAMQTYNITLEDNPDEELNKVADVLSDAETKFAEEQEVDDIGTVNLLVHPVQQKLEILSGFGKRLNKKDTNKTEFSTVVEIKASENTGVLSMFNGVVTYGGYTEEKGETVRITHGNGIITEYNFLKERYVKKGMTVKQYQKIGTANNKGYVKVSLYIDKKAYDPSTLFITNKKEK